MAERVQRFPESVIREMTRQAALHGAINLAQGYPDFDPPGPVVEAAKQALGKGYHQYAITWGAPELREAIAEKAKAYNGIDVDPEANVVVTCGATEAMMAAMLSLIAPGDEVVVFEPFYENYGPDAVVSGAKARFVSLDLPTCRLDEEALKAAFRRRTKAVIVNTPNNPTGKVFTRQELRLLADLCVDHDVVAVTDEIYEHLLYDGAVHVSLATVGDMHERTVTINGLSKTYGVTGWRVGWGLAPKTLADAMKRVHDFLTVGAPHPLQIAGAAALRMPPAYYDDLAAMYGAKRDLILPALEALGFRCVRPQGAYYVMADIAAFPFPDDVACASFLVRNGGVAVVPGSSFYSRPEDGARYVRFTFAKREATLRDAIARLRRLEGGT